MGCCLPKDKQKTFVEPFVSEDMIVETKRRRRLFSRKKSRKTRRRHHQCNSQGAPQPIQVQNDPVFIPVNCPPTNHLRPVVVVNNDKKKRQVTNRNVHSIYSIPSHSVKETRRPRRPPPPPVPMDFSVFISNPSPPITSGPSTSSTSTNILATTDKKRNTTPSMSTGSSSVDEKSENKHIRPKAVRPRARRPTTAHLDVSTMEEHNKIFAPPNLVLQDIEEPNIKFGKYTNRCQTPNGVSFDLVFDDNRPCVTKPALRYPGRPRQHKAKEPTITEERSHESTNKLVERPLKKELVIEESLPIPLYPKVIYVQPLTSNTEEGTRSTTCTSDSPCCKPSLVEETEHDTAQVIVNDTVVSTVTDENMSEDMNNVQSKVCPISSEDILSTIKHTEMPSSSISFSAQNSEKSDTCEFSVKDVMITCDDDMEPQTTLESSDDLEESDDSSFVSIDDDSISVDSFGTCNSEEDTFSFLSSYDSDDDMFTDDTITSEISPANNCYLSPEDERIVDQFIKKRFRMFWRMHRKEKIVVYRTECPDDDEIFHDLFPPKKEAPVKRKRLREFPFMNKDINAAHYLDKYYGIPASSSPVSVSGQRFEGSYIDVKVTSFESLKKDDNEEKSTVSAKSESASDSSLQRNQTTTSTVSTDNVNSRQDSNPQQKVAGKEDDDEEQTFISIMNNIDTRSVNAKDEVEDDFSFSLPVSSEDSKTAEGNTLIVDSASVEEPEAENKTRRTVRFNLQPEIREYYPERDDELLQSDLEDDIELIEF